MTSNNSTQNVNHTIIRYWLYVFQGILLVLLNSLIFLSVLYHRILRERKEYVLPAALAFCDAVEGFSAFMAGFGRNWLILKGKQNNLVTRWDCLLKPWNIGWMFTEQTYDMTLLTISIDRFIAVVWPLFHYGLTSSYKKFLILLAWGPGLCVLPYSVYLTCTHTAKDTAEICFSYYVYDNDYYKIHSFLRTFLSVSSVLLYVVIITVDFIRNKKLQATQDANFKRYQKNQHSMTITLGISCIFTTLLYIMPVLARGLLLESSRMMADLITYSYIIENVNRLANIFLYSMRHRSLRLGIKYFLLKKHLTQNIIDNIVPGQTAMTLRKLNATKKPQLQQQENYGENHNKNINHEEELPGVIL